MLPDKLYEALPYLYLIVGAVAVLICHSVWTLLPASLLFVVGAWVWVIRTEKRRLKTGIQFKAKSAWPFWCYEFYPFALILAGLMLLGHSQMVMLLLPAVISLILGIQHWCCRLSYRRCHS